MLLHKSFCFFYKLFITFFFYSIDWLIIWYIKSICDKCDRDIIMVLKWLNIELLLDDYEIGSLNGN